MTACPVKCSPHNNVSLLKNYTFTGFSFNEAVYCYCDEAGFKRADSERHVGKVYLSWLVLETCISSFLEEYAGFKRDHDDLFSKCNN